MIHHALQSSLWPTGPKLWPSRVTPSLNVFPGPVPCRATFQQRPASHSVPPTKPPPSFEIVVRGPETFPVKAFWFSRQGEPAALFSLHLGSPDHPGRVSCRREALPVAAELSSHRAAFPLSNTKPIQGSFRN